MYTLALIYAIGVLVMGGILGWFQTESATLKTDAKISFLWPLYLPVLAAAVIYVLYTVKRRGTKRE